MDDMNEQISTAPQEKEIDEIFGEETVNIADEIETSRGLRWDFKTFLRFARRKIRNFINKKENENFTNILYLTLDCPPYTPQSVRQDSPIDFAMAMGKQYPYNDIRILIPIIGLEQNTKISKKIEFESENATIVLEKTALSFSFFLQNKKHECVIYKFPKDFSNIQVYGIYCEDFSYIKELSDMYRLQKLALFMKSVRIAVKQFDKIKFPVDIVHSEHIPYYLGSEFEPLIPQGAKVLQIVKDFTQIEMAKPEIFWSAINLADESALGKICKDSIIKKHIARLFNLKQTKKFTRMRECLDSLYENYYRFRKYIEQGEDLDENAIFNRLNMRISEMFPTFANGELYYNQMEYSLKRCDFWAVSSKTYYKEIFENPKIAGKLSSMIEKTKDKSTYLQYGFSINNDNDGERRNIYKAFNVENFRENRSQNKRTLLKEFNMDRITTNFMDSTLFETSAPEIEGYLDSFYEAPLLFFNSNSEIYANGIDIVFNSILKLFDLHKNIQIIINIKNGLQNNFVKSWIKFLSENRSMNGRWVFINGDIKPDKFLAAADMILLPRRVNITTPEHFYAMYYGCVPVAARCGILNDTIIDIFDNITMGCGFKTKTSLLTESDNPEIFLTPLLKALNIYQNNPASWNLLIKNCLNHDFNWDFKTLEKYNKIYQDIL